MKNLTEKDKIVYKLLKRDEIPKPIVSSIMKKFESPVIDIKKEYTISKVNKVYSYTIKNSKYKIITEERYAHITAIVQIRELLSNDDSLE